MTCAGLSRIGIVGPAFPYKGGIAQHTTELAHQLAQRGHPTSIQTWRDQYPRLFYPGVQTVTEPELPVFPDTFHELSWRRPDTWWRVGNAIAETSDVVVFVVVTPVQLPAYEVIARRCRRRGRRLIAVCHNVLPHEARTGDRLLTRRFLKGMDGLIVHSTAERERATALVARRTEVVPLPYFFPDLEPVIVEPGPRHALLFLGFIRRYKGLHILLAAVARTRSRPRLIVAGECWVDRDELRDRAAELGLTDDVDFRFGYVDFRDVPGLLAATDALVLPYLSGTGSQYPRLAHAFGRPAIVTRVGDLADQVRDGTDGLVCEPGSVPALAEAIDRLYQPDALQRLTDSVMPPDPRADWSRYVQAIEELAADHHASARAHRSG